MRPRRQARGARPRSVPMSDCALVTALSLRWKPRSYSPSMALSLSVRTERWPIAGAFTISRGAKTEAVVVVAELSDGDTSRPRRMRALCALRRDRRRRVAAIEAMRRPLARGLDRARPAEPRCRRAPPATRSIARSGISRPSATARRSTSSPGLPAPQAADHRLHDLARHARRRWRRRPPRPPPRAAAQGQARRRGRSGAHRGGARARRRASELIVDANEGWTPATSPTISPPAPHAGVTLVEQPLPAGDDAALARDRAADPGLRRRERA